jgi:YVTN family beta-propeller protein
VNNRLYVVDVGGNSLLIFDGETHFPRYVAGAAGAGIALNVSTDEVYMAHRTEAKLIVAHESGAGFSTVALPAMPETVAVKPVTNKVYVSVKDGTDVMVVDGASKTVAGTIAVDQGPHFIAVNPVTNKIYVLNYQASNVTVIDGATNATATFPVGFHPSNIAVNPATNRIYVSSYGFEPGASCCIPGSTGGVTVIDGATNGTTTIGVDVIRNPVGLAVNPITNTIYVTQGARFYGVGVIDGETNAIRFLSSDWAQGSMVVNPVTNTLYVGQGLDFKLGVYDLNTYVVSSVPSTRIAWAVAANPITNRVYAAYADEIGVVDGATGRRRALRSLRRRRRARSRSTSPPIASTSRTATSTPPATTSP